MKHDIILNKLQSDIRKKLIKRASEGGFYTYSELDEDLGFPYSGLKNSSFIRRIGADLGVISKYELGNRRPLLSAIVVNKGKKEPGSGFYKMAYEVGKLKSVANRVNFAIKEQFKVHEYWKKHIDEDHDDMTIDDESKEVVIDYPFPIKTENRADEVVNNEPNNNQGNFYEDILNDPISHEHNTPFLRYDKDGGTIISRTAKDINEGNINPFKTNWMSVTLYIISFIRELLELIDSALIDEVSQAIEDELNRHKNEDGRYTQVTSYDYGTGKIDGWKFTYLSDWFDYDISIVKAISKEILDNRKKADEYQKKLERLKESKDSQNVNGSQGTSSNLCLDPSLLQEIEDLKAKVEKLTSENAELEKRNNKLEDKSQEIEKTLQDFTEKAEGEESEWIGCFDGFLHPSLNPRAIALALNKVTHSHFTKKERGYWWVFVIVLHEIHWIPKKNYKMALQWANLHFKCGWDWRKDNQFKFSDINKKIKSVQPSSKWNNAVTGNVIGDYYGELAKTMKNSFVEILNDGKLLDRKEFILPGCVYINKGR